MTTATGYGQMEVEYHQFAVYDQKAGLSSYNGKKILQDRYGFIWVSTQDGLNCLNGRTITVFNSSIPSRRLLGNDIHDILEDTLHNLLWVAIPYGGINAIDLRTKQVVRTIPFKEHRPDQFPGGWIRSLYVKGNRLWIGTNAGLCIYEIQEARFLALDRRIKNNIPLPTEVCFIDEDSTGNTWVYSNPFGFVVYNSLTCEPLFAANPALPGLQKTNIRFNNYCHDKTARLFWVATNTGLYCFSYTAGKNYVLSTVPLSRSVSGICSKETFAVSFDKAGKMWFSGEKGLYTFDYGNSVIKQIKSADFGDGDWDRTVQHIFFDRYDNVWLGVYDGLMQASYQPAGFMKYYVSGNGQKLEHAFNLLPLNSHMLLACSENGLYRIDLLSRTIERYLENYYLHTIFDDGKGNIIVSTDKGLMLLTFNSGASAISCAPVSTRFPELKGIEKEIFSSHTFLHDSLLLLSSKRKNGIYIWNRFKRQVQHIDTAGSPMAVPELYIKKLYTDRKNRVWVLGNQYVTVMDFEKQQVTNLALKHDRYNIPYAVFFDIVESGNSYFIASYGNGVIVLNADYAIEKVYSDSSGLPNNSVYNLIQENDSLIWITSNNGLSRLETKSGKINSYDELDGLSSSAFEERCVARFDHALFMGGFKGLSMVLPENIRLNKRFPELYVTDVEYKLNNRDSTFSEVGLKEVVIPNDVLQTNIRFAALNFQNPQKNRFKYRIVEFNKSWIELGNQDFITILGLSPGRYAVEIMASNNDGVWNPVPVRLSVRIIPKWYQTWWFKIAILLAVVAIAYGFYRMRINQLKRVEAIRRKLASDLHDDLGSTLNSVKVYASLAMSDRNDASYLLKIKESTQEAISGIRDIIWVLDDKRDTIEHIIGRIRQFAQPLCEANGITFATQIDEHLYDYKLGKEEKRNLYMIMKETINNSIKYAACKHIEVVIASVSGRLSVRITDDGAGFDHKTITFGNGIKNIETRAKEVGYKANVVSSPGNGTLVHLQKT